MVINSVFVWILFPVYCLCVWMCVCWALTRPITLTNIKIVNGWESGNMTEINGIRPLLVVSKKVAMAYTISRWHLSLALSSQQTVTVTCISEIHEAYSSLAYIYFCVCLLCVCFFFSPICLFVVCCNCSLLVVTQRSLYNIQHILVHTNDVYYYTSQRMYFFGVLTWEWFLGWDGWTAGRLTEHNLCTRLIMPNSRTKHTQTTYFNYVTFPFHIANVK